MNFGEAIEKVNSGHKVAREGWNGKNQFVFKADVLDFGTADGVWNEDIGQANRLPCLVIKTTSNVLQFGWLATQSDIFANDWIVLE